MSREESKNFKKLHEVLRIGENLLLTRVDEIEGEYNTKSQVILKLMQLFWIRVPNVRA